MGRIESSIETDIIICKCLLKGLMLKLKLQYFGHLMGRANLLEKTMMLGGWRAGREGVDGG